MLDGRSESILYLSHPGHQIYFYKTILLFTLIFPSDPTAKLSTTIKSLLELTKFDILDSTQTTRTCFLVLNAQVRHSFIEWQVWFYKSYYICTMCNQQSCTAFAKVSCCQCTIWRAHTIAEFSRKEMHNFVFHVYSVFNLFSGSFADWKYSAPQNCANNAELLRAQNFCYIIFISTFQKC